MPAPPLHFIPAPSIRLADAPPAGDGWLHEIKFDGYRTQGHVVNGEARLFSRSGLDWTDAYRPVAEALAALRCRSAVLDGEMIAPDGRGMSDFNRMRSIIHRKPHELVYVVFDLLYLDGEDLRMLPIEERRARLEQLIGGTLDRLVLSEIFDCEGAKVFEMAEQLGCEGIVSKRKGSLYPRKAGRSWLKTKAFAEGEFALIGIEPSQKSGVSAILATPEMRLAGNAFITLSKEDRQRLWRFIETHRASKPAVPWLRRKNATWVEPGLKARARYLKGEGLLRHASLTGLTS